jgi:hypothetical protein
MRFAMIRPFLARLASMPFIGIRYCEDERRFCEENAQLSPGAMISKFGFWVIGSTLGGNAVTLSDHDQKVRFCDHTGWYDDCMCYAAHEGYAERAYSQRNVENAQVVLAETLDDFERMCLDGEMESIIEKLD